MTAKRLAAIALLGLATAAASLSGCAVVKPWERDVLARTDMAWDPDPQQSALRDHIHFSKEASMPGSGGGGGGCGCN